MDKEYEKSIIVGVNDLFTWCKDNNRLDLIDEWESGLRTYGLQIMEG